MSIRTAAVCIIITLLLAGCGNLPVTTDSSATPAPTQTPAASVQASNTPEEITPSPTVTPAPAPSPTPMTIDQFSEEDQKIIKEKFTFTAAPPSDKKILDGNVKDGFYSVRGGKTQYGHYPYIGLTIKGGQVTEVIFFQYNPEEKDYKDENYGKEYGTQFGDDTFEKAQISVEGGKKYPVQLIETQNIDEVDAVSGATYNHSLFRHGVQKALDLAKK